MNGKLGEGGNVELELLKALRESPDRSIEVVKDERVCERAAVAYARGRFTEPTQTEPRQIRPVLVIRVGTVWFVDDQRARGIDSETAVYSRAWRLIAWFMTGS